MENSDAIKYAVQKLLPFLKSDLQVRLAPMISRIDKDESITSEIVQLFVEQDKETRDWFRLAAFGEFEDGGNKQYNSLEDRIGSVPASTVWVCPKENGHFTWTVRQVGMPIPLCPEHKVQLILSAADKEKSDDR